MPGGLNRGLVGLFQLDLVAAICPPSGILFRVRSFADEETAGQRGVR